MQHLQPRSQGLFARPPKGPGNEVALYGYSLQAEGIFLRIADNPAAPRGQGRTREARDAAVDSRGRHQPAGPHREELPGHGHR